MGRLGALSEVADLILPLVCALCADPGASLCAGCRALVRPAIFTGGPQLAMPNPAPAGMPQCYAAATGSPALRAVVTAFKDEGRADLVRALARLLASAAGAALGSSQTPAPILLIPVPSSARARRRRGRSPTTELAAGSARLLPGPISVLDALIPVRRTADQSGLDYRARAMNVSGAYTVRARARALIRDQDCVVVDDVVTTGSTVTEAARALRVAGAASVRAATIAATARRCQGGAAAGEGDASHR